MAGDRQSASTCRMCFSVLESEWLDSSPKARRGHNQPQDFKKVEELTLDKVTIVKTHNFTGSKVSPTLIFK